MTEEQKRAYIHIHNQLTMNTGFDMEILEAELKSIVGIDMEFFGFDMDFEVDLDLDFEEEEEDVDALLAAAEKEPRAKRGDIYQLGQHRLMCGDSTCIEDVEALMDGAKADMVFTDPPWNVNYGGVKPGNPQGYRPRTILNDFMGTEDFKNFMLRAFAALNFASKDGAMTYVVMSAQEWGNMMLTLAENNYHWSSTIIWNKDSLVLSRKDYHTKYEPIWYGWKDGTRLCPLEDRKQSDVWDIPRPKKSEEHPTMKPVELVVRAITNSSKRGNVVLDLFGGSGTTLIAAEHTDRHCRMMELDPKYVDVIVKRWENLTGERAVLLNGAE
jgi:DNA modification methylase